jgi:hypothetical protein
VFIYLFLIERVHIVRGRTWRRLDDKLYWLNLMGLVPYFVIGILGILFRVDAMGADGQCMIGIHSQVALAVISYDLFINVIMGFRNELMG